MDDEQSAAAGRPYGQDERHEEPEVVDGVIVLAGVRAIEPVREGPPPLRQVAAVAATGFVAGAATAAVLGRRFSRGQARRLGDSAPPALRPGADALEVVSSRRFVVDVHRVKA